MNVDDGDRTEELDAFIATLQNEAVVDELAGASAPPVCPL